MASPSATELLARLAARYPKDIDAARERAVELSAALDEIARPRDEP